MGSLGSIAWRVEGGRELRVEVLLASDGTPDEHNAFVTAEGLESLSYILSPDLGISFGASKLPVAALVDHEGVLRARGLVNTREHLESLLEAMELGVGTIQEYLEREAKSETQFRVSSGG